jgi:regulatory protein YycH of two-component signal transduction system YycFG
MEISGNGAGLKIKRSDITHSLFRDLKNQMFKSKPSLIVMFTDQHRSFFERTLFPSKTEQLSFGTSIPLLAFQKK